MYCDEDYEPTQEEMEEMDGLESTKVKHNNEVINISFNTENFASGIVTAVVQSLKENIYREVVDQIRKECLEDIHEKNTGADWRNNKRNYRRLYEYGKDCYWRRFSLG